MRGRRSSFISNGAGELALLDRIRRRATRLTSGEIRLGIGDDCAILRFRRGEEAVITTDLSIQNRHFRLETHIPEVVGHRTLARGLSDIASMGARPVAAFLSLGVPQELTRSTSRKPAWIDRFLHGFLALAEKYHTPLAGGDLAESPIALADIVIVGASPKGKALLRSGARPGDLIYVTGALGGSAAGLRRIGERPSTKATFSTARSDLAPHLWPVPRIQQGLWLRQRGVATSAIDLSDGLSTDLDHLCAESRASAMLDANALPIFPGATRDDALHGGEDYELLFTAPPRAKLPRQIAGVTVKQIGKIAGARKAENRVVLMDASGCWPLKPRGWEHFR